MPRPGLYRRGWGWGGRATSLLKEFSVYSPYGTSVLPTGGGGPRPVDPGDRRNYPSRRQRADDPGVVRVPRWPDLAQRRPAARLVQAPSTRPARVAAGSRSEEHVSPRADPGTPGRLDR